MNGLPFDAVDIVLAVPLVAAGVLALLPSYQFAAKLNVVATFVTMIGALSLFVARPAPGVYILVDDLNIVFIILNSFVGFTASVFSASYIGHELETGRLTPAHLRFYHAMYQILLFAMLLRMLQDYDSGKMAHLSKLEAANVAARIKQRIADLDAKIAEDDDA